VLGRGGVAREVAGLDKGAEAVRQAVREAKERCTRGGRGRVAEEAVGKAAVEAVEVDRL
jgi:hypothetical protein